MRWTVVMLAIMTWSSAASADPQISLDPAISRAIERDNLMRPTDPSPIIAQPQRDDDHAHLWRAIDMTALIASTAALACDWRQTRSAAVEEWSGGRYESGYSAMALGAHPSVRSVDVYFVGTAVLNVALWAVLPRRWRSIIPGVVVGTEAYTVVGNIPTTHL